MGFFTWVFGGAAPSQQVVDMVGVYFPAVMGALLVFPVFFIGRAVFNKWAGLTAALFIALLPGEFLVRTLLGNTDAHIMEIFFSTFFMLFLVLAVQSGKSLELYPWQQVKRRTLIKPVIYCLLAGLCLGIYIISWAGALFFVLISFAWLVAQLIINHLRGTPSGYLGLSGIIIYVAALLVTLAGPGGCHDPPVPCSGHRCFSSIAAAFLVYAAQEVKRNILPSDRHCAGCHGPSWLFM